MRNEPKGKHQNVSIDRSKQKTNLTYEFSILVEHIQHSSQI